MLSCKCGDQGVLCCHASVVIRECCVVMQVCSDQGVLCCHASVVIRECCVVMQVW